MSINKAAYNIYRRIKAKTGMSLSQQIIAFIREKTPREIALARFRQYHDILVGEQPMLTDIFSLFVKIINCCVDRTGQLEEAFVSEFEIELQLLISKIMTAKSLKGDDECYAEEKEAPPNKKS